VRRFVKVKRRKMEQKGSIVGGWQSDKDMDERKKIIVKI
jgi:hypothetical protein